MKIKTVVLTVLILTPVCLLAQTNAPPGGGLPETKADYWRYAISIITPLLIGGFRKLVPNIPTWLLPVSTPFVGMALGAGLNWLGASNMSWVDMAQAGGLAVLVYESYKEIVSKRMTGEGISQPRP